jgi:predicted AAA+ superfamily ATPase
MYIERAIEGTVLTISSQSKVLLVTGPRQVGKTTLLKKLAKGKRNYVTLDDYDTRDRARRDPKLFFQEFPLPVLIDEIQYAPELLSAIKIMVDSSNRMGSVWLTGSQHFSLMKNVSESLAGRVGIVPLLGLSNAEIDRRPSWAFVPVIDDLRKREGVAHPFAVTEAFSRIYRGSLPAAYSAPISSYENFYSSYVDTYIKRDVNDLTQVTDQTAFFRFMRVAAAHTGQVLNISTLADNADIAPNTAKQWLSILTTTGLVILVEPFFSNVLSRIRKAPKMHFMDLGLCAFLMGWPNAETIERSSSAGAFFESWVVSELYKGHLNAGRTPRFFYYRDQRKQEIDLIIQKGTTLHPVEIKKAASIRKRDVDSIRMLRKKFAKADGEGDAAALYTVGSGCAIGMGDGIGFLSEDDVSVPAWMI